MVSSLAIQQGHTGQTDDELTEYSLTFFLLLKQCLGINSFRPTWPCLIIEILASRAKFLQPYSYCSFIFNTANVFGCFHVAIFLITGVSALTTTGWTALVMGCTRSKQANRIFQKSWLILVNTWIFRCSKFKQIKVNVILCDKIISNLDIASCNLSNVTNSWD